MYTLLLVFRQGRKSCIWQGATDDRPKAMKQFWFENLENFEGQETPVASHFIRVGVNEKASRQELPADWND